MTHGDTGSLGVRIDPATGYVAQKFPRDFNGHGSWLLTYIDDNDNLAVRALSDDEVRDWPELVSREVGR
jgi:hypothetical protein